MVRVGDVFCILDDHERLLGNQRLECDAWYRVAEQPLRPVETDCYGSPIFRFPASAC